MVLLSNILRLNACIFTTCGDPGSVNCWLDHDECSEISIKTRFAIFIKIMQREVWWMALHLVWTDVDHLSFRGKELLTLILWVWWWISKKIIITKVLKLIYYINLLGTIICQSGLFQKGTIPSSIIKMLPKSSKMAPKWSENLNVKLPHPLKLPQYLTLTWSCLIKSRQCYYLI